MKNEHGLTQRREKFARCVAEGMSGADAYRASFKVGRMKPEHIHVEASELIADPKVRRRISDLQSELAERSVLKAADVLRSTAQIMMASPARLIRRQTIDGREQAVALMPDELDPDTAAAVASFEIDGTGRIKYRFWDKNTAGDRAARLLGLYEKDNKQRGGDIAALLEALQGNVVRPHEEAALPYVDDGDEP